MTNSFCPVPWNFQAIQNNGAVRVCCQMNVTPGRGTLKKDDGTPYKAAVDDLTAARNANLIKDVRRQMLNGEWPDDCARCRTEEESGLRSRRVWENEAWKMDPTHVAQYTDRDGTIDTNALPLVYYDMRFGNFCNLACRMCGPEDSHTWYKDWVDIGMGSSWKDTHGEVVLEKNERGRWVTDAYDWHGSESFWDQLEANLHNIQMIYMAGGEPLLIERHYDFLQKCIDADVAKNIVLEYNTNLTNVQLRVIEMWKHFGQVRIGASIDGIGDVLEYQRYPAKWETIERNLHVIDNLPDNVRAWISATVTLVNVWQFPDFMLWKLEQNFKKINKTEIINYHVCHRPWSSNIRVLPYEYKTRLEEFYNSKRAEFEKYDNRISKSANNILDSIVKYARAEDESNRLSQFVDFTRKLDHVRNQNIIDVVPQYKKLFDK
jgi:sulfatase maturation enzyme AslB (radical SAM superfamily)